MEPPTGLFRSSRPDYIETSPAITYLLIISAELFRSSRPDYIETSGTSSLRLFFIILFRSSRPDYIETPAEQQPEPPAQPDCSGLLGRTTLRLNAIPLNLPRTSIVPVF